MTTEDEDVGAVVCLHIGAQMIAMASTDCGHPEGFPMLPPACAACAARWFISTIEARAMLKAKDRLL